MGKRKRESEQSVNPALARSSRPAAPLQKNSHSTSEPLLKLRYWEELDDVWLADIGS
jgi:hypothetical protein